MSGERSIQTQRMRRSRAEADLVAAEYESSGVGRKEFCQRIALRANIAETLLVPLITEQGGNGIQHEEHEDILSGPVGRVQ